MFFTSIWLLSKSAFVEGILDGSRLSDGKSVTVRDIRDIRYTLRIRISALKETHVRDTLHNKRYTKRYIRAREEIHKETCSHEERHT